MDPSAYVSLGIAGLVLVATIALAFWAKSLSDRGNGLADQLLADAKDSAQKTLDAERAKADLAVMAAERDRWQMRSNALDAYIASSKDTDHEKLPANDLLDRVVSVSSRSSPNVSAAGTTATGVTGTTVLGPRPSGS
jgi:hypothetical protein